MRTTLSIRLSTPKLGNLYQENSHASNEPGHRIKIFHVQNQSTKFSRQVLYYIRVPANARPVRKEDVRSRVLEGRYFLEK
jgi:hypothetical protein